MKGSTLHQKRVQKNKQYAHSVRLSTFTALHTCFGYMTKAFFAFKKYENYGIVIFE